jgi:uncharacterized membrane protein
MNPAINVHRGVAAPNQSMARMAAKEATSAEEVQAYRETRTGTSETTATAKWVYILSLASFIIPFTNIVGLILAYIKRPEAPYWLATHYQFQIRTFWIGLLYAVISIALMAVAIGFILIFAVAIWLLIRYIKGLNTLNRKEAYPNPTSWLF